MICVALAIDETSFELVTALAGPVEVIDGTGKVVAQGNSSVHQPIVGQFDGSAIVIRRNGKVLLEQALPDARPAPEKDTKVPEHIRRQYDALIAQDPYELEKECLGTNHSPSNDIRVKGAVQKVTADTDPRRAFKSCSRGISVGVLSRSTAGLCVVSESRSGSFAGTHRNRVRANQ